MKFRILSALMVLGFLLVSCGEKRMELLSERTKKYNRAVRWSSVGAASTMMAPKVRRELSTKLANTLGQGGIVDFSVIDLGINEDESEAAVLVEFSFYKDIDQTLRYRQELQTWKFDKKEKEWFLHESRLMASQ